MKKDIKDYLHLYIGSKVWTTHLALNNGEPQALTVSINNLFDILYKYHDSKLILRPLSSITEEENKRWKAKMHKQYSGGAGHTGYLENPESFRYLLSIGIDLFGLIDSGLAVTAETLK